MRFEDVQALRKSAQCDSNADSMKFPRVIALGIVSMENGGRPHRPSSMYGARISTNADPGTTRFISSRNPAFAFASSSDSVPGRFVSCLTCSQAHRLQPSTFNSDSCGPFLTQVGGSRCVFHPILTAHPLFFSQCAQYSRSGIDIFVESELQLPGSSACISFSRALSTPRSNCRKLFLRRG